MKAAHNDEVVQWRNYNAAKLRNIQALRASDYSLAQAEEDIATRIDRRTETLVEP